MRNTKLIIWLILIIYFHDFDTFDIYQPFIQCQEQSMTAIRTKKIGLVSTSLIYDISAI